LSTGGTRAMSEIHTGLIARVRSVAPFIQWIHCSKHRDALAIKGLDGISQKLLMMQLKSSILLKQGLKTPEILLLYIFK